MKNEHHRSVWILSLILLAGCVTGPRGFPPAGSANFDRVDDRLFRGAQPHTLGLENLQKLGIRTIINLRMTNDCWAAEADQAKALGLTYIAVPMHGWRRPQMQTVERILTLIDESPGPVVLHCQHGCDRTGVIVACYRIRHGWTAEAALREAKMFGMSPWEVRMKSFIKDFGRKGK